MSSLEFTYYSEVNACSVAAFKNSLTCVQLRGAWPPPERPGGPLETPGLRRYKGASKRPPEITRQIQYMILQHINIILSTDVAAPSPATWLRLSSLDVRIAHVYGVGVAVHNHGRFVWVTADVKHDFHYLGHNWNNIVSVFRKVLHTVCQPVRYTLLFNSSQSH